MVLAILMNLGIGIVTGAILVSVIMWLERGRDE